MHEALGSSPSTTKNKEKKKTYHFLPLKKKNLVSQGEGMTHTYNPSYLGD
jgi:hypothetical protein